MAVTTFGNFPAQNFAEFKDTSWNGDYAPNCGWNGPDRFATATWSTPPFGGNAVILISDDRAVNVCEDPPPGVQHSRLHLIGVFGGNPAYFAEGSECWGCRSILIPTANNAANLNWNCDEIHGGNGTGVAPFLLQVQVNPGPPQTVQVQLIETGGSHVPADDTYQGQVIFGELYPGQTITAPTSRVSWVGGPNGTGLKLDTWYHFLHGRLFDSNGNGWFEAWFYDTTVGSWVQIVPRHSGIYTNYPPATGAPTPYLSVYGQTAGPEYTYPSPAPSAGVGLRSASYAAGAFASSISELAWWQAGRLGIAPAGQPPSMLMKSVRPLHRTHPIPRRVPDQSGWPAPAFFLAGAPPQSPALKMAPAGASTLTGLDMTPVWTLSGTARANVLSALFLVDDTALPGPAAVSDVDPTTSTWQYASGFETRRYANGPHKVQCKLTLTNSTVLDVSEMLAFANPPTVMPPVRR